MKKVLYVTTVSRTINAFLVPHIEMLLKEGYEVQCACSIDKPINKGLLEKGVKIYDIPFSRNPLGLGNIRAFNNLVKIQKREKFDIVHVHTPIASIYGRLLKLIYTAHGYHFLKGGSKLGWIMYYPIEKIMAKLTDTTININSEDYEITKNKLKPKNCYLLNGVGLDLNQYKKLSQKEILSKKKELGLKENDFVVLMIAELNENKNQVQLIEAMEVLKDTYPEIKAICVGEGDKLSELQSEVKNRGLEGKVNFLGFRNDINELINICNIGVLLSYREGLPRNLMELMACGKKVIATNIRGCRDIVVDETVGEIVEVGDYEATAKAIENQYLYGDNQFIISKEIEKYDVKTINEGLRLIYKELEEGGYYHKEGYAYSANE